MRAENFVEMEVDRKRFRLFRTEEQRRHRTDPYDFRIKLGRVVANDIRLFFMNGESVFASERARIKKREALLGKVEKRVVFGLGTRKVPVEKERGAVGFLRNETRARPREIATIRISEQFPHPVFEIVLHVRIGVDGLRDESGGFRKISYESDPIVEISAGFVFRQRTHFEFHAFVFRPCAEIFAVDFFFDDEPRNGFHTLPAQNEFGIVDALGEAFVNELPRDARIERFSFGAEIFPANVFEFGFCGHSLAG